MKVLVVDIGGNSVKVLVTGVIEPRKFPSGRTLTARQMVSAVLKLTEDWKYDVVSIGYPGRVRDNKPALEPVNLGRGWVGFDFSKAFGVPVKVINDAAMQAMGSYREGRMLFLGLGTGLGMALIMDGHVIPMEVHHLPYRHGSVEDYVGLKALERVGIRKWREYCLDVIARFTAAFEIDYTVVGGGNVNKLDKLPAGCRIGDNALAFRGGFLLWARDKRRQGTGRRTRSARPSRRD